MSINIIGLIVLVVAVIVWPLWVIVEIQSWSVLIRLLAGCSVVVVTSLVCVAICQVKAATREHYYRDALLSVSRMTVAGNTESIRDSLEKFTRKAERSQDISSVLELSKRLAEERNREQGNWGQP